MSIYHTKQVGFVSHVEIKVVDFNKSIPFYTEMLGFKLLSQKEDLVILGTEDNVPLVSLRQLVDGKRNTGRTAGLYHFALLLPSRKELGMILVHFIKQQVPIQGASDHGISEAIYLADPDGNGIEIAADTDSSTWPSFDRSVEWFAVNRPLDVEGVVKSSETIPFDKLPKGTVLGHIHLHVSELKKTKEFYQVGLGMDIVMEFEDSAIFFSYGRYHHHIATNVWNGKGVKQPAEQSTGLHYFDLLLPDKATLDNVLKNLKELGYPGFEQGDFYLVKDPSGNQIRIRI